MYVILYAAFICCCASSKYLSAQQKYNPIRHQSAPRTYSQQTPTIYISPHHSQNTSIFMTNPIIRALNSNIEVCGFIFGGASFALDIVIQASQGHQDSFQTQTGAINPPVFGTQFIQLMDNTVQILIKKYPSLAYFDITEAVSPQELSSIAPEVHIEPKNMSPRSKQVHKSIRKFALAAEEKMKNGRQLYKTLKQHNENLQSIILNNAKLKSIEALQYKCFERLTELQLESNEIRSISPLRRLKAPSLKEIDLSSNCIGSLTPIKDVLWPKLKVLNLSQNNIVSLQGLPLSSFRTIKVINLSDNFLTQVRWLRKVITAEMTELKQLNLSNNEITELGWLGDCHFYQLQALNLRNNKYGCFVDIEKVKMNLNEYQKGRICISHYEILVSSGGKQSNYCLKYRQLSRHKLSAKIEPNQPRSNRQHIQKSRRLILI